MLSGPHRGYDYEYEWRVGGGTKRVGVGRGNGMGTLFLTHCEEASTKRKKLHFNLVVDNIRPSMHVVLKLHHLVYQESTCIHVHMLFSCDLIMFLT